MPSLFEEIERLKVGCRKLAIFWLGQNSFIMKTSRGTIFAVDLYLSRSEKFKYVYPEPPMRPEEFRGKYVFCTHDHLDHTDPISLPIIAKCSPDTIFFGPRESCEHLVKLGVEENRVKVLEAGSSYKIGDLRVTPYYSVPPWETECGDLRITHFGYVFEVEGIKAYNMGDSSKSILKDPEKFLEPVIKERVDVAMLPIIGDIPERKPEDAFLLAKVIKPKIVIPCHYDCFQDRTINPKVFVQLFREELDIKPVVIPYRGLYIYEKTN
ncbi:MAG: MBL fold metallo-hydrolase [Candidatus Bathyarchaeia archaeon]